jgi:SAM-dependent MidA family methyltransferase
LSELLEKIASEIQFRGALSFARFMELALYCPVYGYYEKERDTIGQTGDFYTSVSATSLFGKLLAAQFAEWAGNGLDRLLIVEGGAHRGQLALDILKWLRQWRPSIFARLEYCIVEPSTWRREWQYQTLDGFADHLRWVKQLSELGGAHQTGTGGQTSTQPVSIVFCNELLDAMPVHRWGWDKKRHNWFEWGVTLDQGNFVWTRMKNRAHQVTSATNSKNSSNMQDRGGSPLLSATPTKEEHTSTDPSQVYSMPQRLMELMPDGFTMETCPAAVHWWRTAAEVLERGKLLCIDYGFIENELFVPERTEGTLRAYRNHQHSPNPLADPGEQDLTAHVNFSLLQSAGESAGLMTESLLTQAQFLTSLASRIWNGTIGFEPWTTGHSRQFQTLAHPEHLGQTFKVLVQSTTTLSPA